MTKIMMVKFYFSNLAREHNRIAVLIIIVWINRRPNRVFNSTHTKSRNAMSGKQKKKIGFEKTRVNLTA